MIDRTKIDVICDDCGISRRDYWEHAMGGDRADMPEMHVSQILADLGAADRIALPLGASPYRDVDGDPIPVRIDGMPTRLPHLTGETISDEEIEDLYAAAGAHGDLEQACVCLLALGRSDGCERPAEDGTPYATVLDRYGLGPGGLSRPIPASARDAAREECARAIVDGITRMMGR